MCQIVSDFSRLVYGIHPVFLCFYSFHVDFRYFVRHKADTKSYKSGFLFAKSPEPACFQFSKQRSSNLTKYFQNKCISTEYGDVTKRENSTYDSSAFLNMTPGLRCVDVKALEFK